MLQPYDNFTSLHSIEAKLLLHLLQVGNLRSEVRKSLLLLLGRLLECLDALLLGLLRGTKLRKIWRKIFVLGLQREHLVEQLFEALLS